MNQLELMRRIFPSREMADYLTNYEFAPEALAEIITGSPIPLREKLDILTILAGQGDSPFAVLAQETAEAMSALSSKPGEFFYLKNCWPDYDQGDTDIVAMGPYPDLEKAMDEIHQFLEKEECTGNSGYWFLLEKWVLDKTGNYVCPYSYVVVNGEILYFEAPGKGRSHMYFLPYESTNLNLPIPFRPGDIVQLDCAPFAFRTNAVLLEVGDNCDCCCVQAMFRNENGTWSAGALKHSHVFPNGYRPLLSPLYRLSKRQQKLKQEEQILEEVSQFIAGNDKTGAALWNKNFYGASSGVPDVEIRKYIERENSGTD